MKKCIGIAIVLFVWLGVMVLGQRGRYDFTVPGVFDSIRVGNFTISQDAVDNDGIEINGSVHSAAVSGIAGNICIHDGNEPTQSNSANGSRIWTDPNGVLQHQKSTNAGGGSVVIATGSGDLSDYLKKDGSVPLTSDWDIGDARKILTDEIRARDTAGLKLYDDGGKGIFVKDGGNVGIGTTDPKREFDFDGANVRTQRYFDSDLNTNLGYETFGAENLSGTHNSAFGRHNLYSITSGSGNSGLGNETLYGVTTGSNNVGVGSMSGKGVSGGSHNISLGYKSGYVVADGDNNISIGSYSNYVGTGSKNIIIGYNIDLPIDAGNNQLNIGNLIYGTGLDGVDKAVSAGKVGIGVVDPAAKLEVNGYTMLGSDAPKIKVKKITGTTDAGAQTAIAHGLTASKILNVFSTIQNNNTYYYVPNMFTSGNSNYYYHTWETTNIYFSGVGSGLQGRPYKILITYEE